MNGQEIVWIISGIFVGATTLCTAALIYRHLHNYNYPRHQRLIVRILLMAPIYAVDSFLSLLFRNAAVYLNTVRNCYESFVIYSFFSLLLQYLGGMDLLVMTLATKQPQKHVFPLCCCPRFRAGITAMRRIRQGCLQYVIINVLLAIAALIFNFVGLYEDGHLRVDRSYLYILIVDNCSITVSMYCLILFYNICSDELTSHRPVFKLLMIKAVIFFSFWQGVLVAVLSHFDLVHAIGDWTQEDVATGVQNFLICIEMFMAALAHHWAFSAYPYMSEDATPLWASIKDAIGVTDVAADTLELFVPRSKHKHLPEGIRKQFRGPLYSEQYPQVPLLAASTNTADADAQPNYNTM